MVGSRILDALRRVGAAIGSLFVFSSDDVALPSDADGLCRRIRELDRLISLLSGCLSNDPISVEVHALELFRYCRERAQVERKLAEMTAVRWLGVVDLEHRTTYVLPVSSEVETAFPYGWGFRVRYRREHNAICLRREEGAAYELPAFVTEQRQIASGKILIAAYLTRATATEWTEKQRAIALSPFAVGA